MIIKIVEVTNNDKNWGKFMVMRPDVEWQRPVKIVDGQSRSLLAACGWDREHIWVLDLQTGEGIYVRPSGLASADLNEKHQVWVCPMFEPFLNWLYKQDLTDLNVLPDTLNLSDAEFALHGYRRQKGK